MSSAAGAAFAEPKAAAAPAKTAVPAKAVALAKAAASTYKVTVEGKAIAFKKAPVVEGKTVLVPAHEFMAAIGGKAKWDSMTKSVLLSKDKTSIRLYADSSTGYKAGKAIKAPAKTKPFEGAVLVPIVFVAKEFGATVTWDEKVSSFHVTLPKAKK
jgi:hypothetical protein